MSNILQFPALKSIGTKDRQFCADVLHDARRRTVNGASFAAMPASITGNATLNRVATALQRKGWQAEVHSDGTISFVHSRIPHRGLLSVHDAHDLQRFWEGAE